MTLFAIRPGPLYRSRDPKYRAYVRQFPCAGCGTDRRGRDAAHQGPHGIGQKASDLDCVPLCRQCHKRLHKIGPAAFWNANPRDLGTLQRMYRRFYRLKHGTPDWWPNQPALTLETCQVCGVETFSEELEIAGRCECGEPRPQERAA